MADSIVVTVGDVVVVAPPSSSATSKPFLALVTGVASSGDTADIEVLDEFVRSLYVRSGDTTYVPVAKVRPIKAEYVDAQDGWIVLAEDMERIVASSFRAVPLDEGVESSGAPDVKVVAAAAKEVAPELQGGLAPFPMPTKSQALRGAGVAVAVGLLMYLGYANVRGTFESSPLAFDEGSQGAAVATSYVFFFLCLLALLPGAGRGAHAADSTVACVKMHDGRWVGENTTSTIVSSTRALGYTIQPSAHRWDDGVGIRGLLTTRASHRSGPRRQCIRQRHVRKN